MEDRIHRRVRPGIGFVNPSMPKTNKALLYARVSTENQADDGYSREAQVRQGIQYAKDKVLTIVKTWKVAESAWKTDRKAFNEMIDLAKRRKDIGHIIFDVTDRMTRNDQDKVTILSLIKDHRIWVHLARSRKVWTPDMFPDDEFMLDIETAAAKRYSNDISLKASMGMREKAACGDYPSTAPLGYLNNKNTGLIEIDCQRSDLVEKAFELMATGNFSLDTLRIRLNELGLTTKKGNPIHKASLAHLLKNPFFYGHYRWNGEMFKGNYQPIISKTIWDRVQDVTSGRWRPSKRRKYGFPFNQLIKCDTCGGSILGEMVKGKYTYYHCSFSIRKHKGPYVRGEEMPRLFEKLVKGVTIPDDIADWILELIRHGQKDASEYGEKRIRQLRLERGKYQARLGRLLDMRIDGELNAKEFEQKQSEYQGRLKDIDDGLLQMERSIGSVTEQAHRILELCKRLYSVYLEVDDRKKVELVRVIGSNFILIDRTVCGTYRKPFSFLANLPNRLIKLPRLDSN